MYIHYIYTLYIYIYIVLYVHMQLHLYRCAVVIFEHIDRHCAWLCHAELSLGPGNRDPLLPVIEAHGVTGVGMELDVFGYTLW